MKIILTLIALICVNLIALICVNGMKISIVEGILNENEFDYVFDGNVKRTTDFCQNNGYWISNESYSYESAEIVCAIIGKKVVVPNQENFNYIGFALAMCNGEESNAWVNDCSIFKADSYFCGSLFDSDTCDNFHPVICQ